MALFQRDGVWYVRKTVRGQRYRISTGMTDRKLAERREAEIVRELWSGAFGWKERKAPTFREWAEKYKTGIHGAKTSAVARPADSGARVAGLWVPKDRSSDTE
jgi:hypothetical protein